MLVVTLIDCEVEELPSDCNSIDSLELEDDSLLESSTIELSCNESVPGKAMEVAGATVVLVVVLVVLVVEAVDPFKVDPFKADPNRVWFNEVVMVFCKELGNKPIN